MPEPHFVPYTGPRPSPARPFAPWVILVSALLAIGNAAQFVYNWLERGYQQQVRALRPPSVARIHNTISKIHTLGKFTLFAAGAYLIVVIIWSSKRRPRSRLNRDGESGVEPSLRTIAPIAYWATMGAVAVSLLLTNIATSHSHTGATVNDFIAFRTYLAFGDIARVVLWTAWIVVVAQATSFQLRREAIPLVPANVYAATTWSAPAAETLPAAASVGWHPVENDPHRQSYWDGASWTAHKRWDGANWIDVDSGH